MITLLVLAIVLLTMALIAVITILVGGAAFLVTFGDWIIAGIIILLVVSWIIKKVKNK